jgi:16S rRNA (cytosine967-C5)-methyltransferase
MIDSSTLNHAARVLEIVSPEIPADGALRRYLAESRRLGPREKRAISRAVFIYFRWLQWLDRKVSAQKRVEQAINLHDKFSQNPSSIKPQALAALAVPEWLKEEVELPIESLRQLQREPVLWLRARAGTAKKIAAELGRCSLADLSVIAPHVTHDALRFEGQQDLFLTPQFHAGAFEIQDLASQLVGLACDAKPGQTWWDACAGEGGKMLHLADLMQNKGLIWATDRSARRLQSLKRRASRAKVFNFRNTIWDGSASLPTKTKFDGILIDAPCSGVGTWQRNPHARWNSSITDVRELAEVQLRLLQHAADSLKPGGRLVYAVCTLTRSETTAVADAFTAAHPELVPAPVFPAAAAQPATVNAPSSTLTSQLTLWPHQLEANGMFIAAWEKKR